MYVPVGELPQHVIEVMHRTRRFKFLGDVGTALGIGTVAALVFRGDDDADGDIFCVCHVIKTIT
jgi:hypothetical protein